MGMYGWHDNDLKVDDLEVDGTLTFGDAATDNLIIKGRVSSLTAAGSAIQITSSYAYGEGVEMRYQVTDWTGVGSSFKGMYLRSEAKTTAASGKSIYGAEIYGVCNNVTMTTGSLWGALFYSYVKGVGAVTVNNMYAVQGELTWDANRTGDCIISTAAACFRAKITGGRVADYTKIHGYELTIGEMDGDSAKFGKGLFMQDDSDMSGTCTLTTGIDITIGCTTGMLIAGATTEAIDITGNATRAINIDTGAFTSGLTMSAAFSGNAISVTNSALTAGDSYSGVRVAVTGASAINAYGMAGYFDTTITGTTAGHCYGLGSWINTATTPVLSAGHIIVPLECGVYTGEAQASARIVLGQFQAILNGAPASLHVFRINTTQTTTAIFTAANAGSIGYAASAGTSSSKNGDIPIADVVGHGVVYVRTYDAAG